MRWLNEWVAGWMVGWLDEWMDGWLDIPPLGPWLLARVGRLGWTPSSLALSGVGWGVRHGVACLRRSFLLGCLHPAVYRGHAMGGVLVGKDEPKAKVRKGIEGKGNY